MSSCPQISFVMPAFKAQFLKAAIESIVSQSFHDWELIIVDDCSPYDLETIANTFCDNRIRYYRNVNNIGGKDLVRQWNHSIQYAKGEWLVLAADDDIYNPEFCNEIVKLTQAHPDVDLIRSRVLLIDGHGTPGWQDGSFPECIDRREFIKNWVDNKSFVCIGNFAFRRKRLLEIGGFINFPSAFYSDIATPVMMADDGVANTRDMLFSFRISDIHVSADRTKYKDKIVAVTMFYKWLSQIKDLPIDLDFVHRKCVFDYFGQVLKYLDFHKFILFLKYCELATLMERIIYIPRWIKYRFAKSTH